MSGEICTDNRFEIIAAYKKKLVEGTNIQARPEEMEVIDNILFRFWQMGRLPPIPHGRLIDAEALLANDKRMYDTYRGANGRDTLLDDACHRAIQWSIEDAPTIIPAEPFNNLSKPCKDDDDIPICTKASPASLGIYKNAEES